MSCFQWKLKHCMIIGISGIIILTSLILLLFPTISYTKLYEEQTINYCKNFSLQIATDLTNRLEQYEQKIDNLIDDPSFRLLLNPNMEFTDATYQYLHIISNYFKKDSLDGYYLQEIDCYLWHANQPLAYGSKPTELVNTFNSSYYYTPLLAPTTLNWIGYDQKSDSNEISRIIYDYNNYKPIGLLIMRLSLSFFSDVLSKYEQENVGQINILTNRGSQISPIKKTITSQNDIDNCFNASSSGTLNSLDSWIIYSKLKDTYANYPYEKWTVMVSITKTSVLQNYQQMELLFILTAIGIAVIAVLITVKFSTKVTTPIGNLAKAMKTVQQGELNTQLNEHSHINEINDLSHGFNQMTEQLNQLINTVYKSKLAEKDSQLRVLKSQINPHFLFNTLQLIGWKAHEYDADEISDMISSLSYMLAADLYTGNEQCFTLEDELEYIHHYITIIHQKYKDKIIFQLNAQPECLQCRIPKMILQPFVENAVVHGIAPKTEPGTIQIEINIKNSDLYIQITDDGVGMRNDILEEIHNNNELTSSDSKGHHIALKNIQNRIHLLYGTEYGFTIKSQFYQGTTIILKLPVNNERTNQNDQSTNC